MTKLTLPSRAAATAAAALSPCILALACPWQALAAGSAKTRHGAAADTHHAAAKGASTASENLPWNTGGTTTTAAHSSSSGGASLTRTIVGLAIVIAVIWGLSWILRQVKAGRDPNVSSAGLSSIAALTLGSGRSVHLVRAGSEYVLLGSAEHGVVPIHRYTEQEAREAGLLVAEEPPQRRGWGLVRPPERTERAHDPMRMGSPNSALIDRLREWTVRR
jgi:flagellar protein FliO/FliZ